MNPDLAAFLEHARSKGMDHGTIRMLLLSAGWKEKDVAKALAEHSLDMAVNIDRAAVAEPELLRACLAKSFKSLAAIAD